VLSELQPQVSVNGEETPNPTRVGSVPPEALARIQSLYEAGHCLQAYRATQEFGPLKLWKGPDAQTLAARLASNLGGYQLGRVLHRLAYRSDRTHPDRVSYQAYTLLQRRGPLVTWEFLERFGKPPEGSEPESLSHFFTMRATVAAELRDFDAAGGWLERARGLTPQHPWVPTTRARVLELQDRYPESLDAARQALELRRWYRPGVQAVAHALQLLDRDEEALALLTEATAHLENMHIVRQLASLQQELQLYTEAAENFSRLVELAPLMEKPERLWLERHRVTLDCLRDNFIEALAGAKRIDEPYYREFAHRLEQGGSVRRVRLEVPFVRQHRLTCVPATLSAISRFWQQPAEHLEVAEAICYDGTPAHSERHWAETHGWAVREFTVTWEAAKSLLDRGVPFTLSTSEATSGHVQAVVGYDELRQTLWIRDPFVYYANESSVKPLLERYRSTGPRGMALVPTARRELLEGLDLPEAGLYDQLYAVQRALAQHRRADALSVCQEMQRAAPTHRLTLTARRAIAGYDGNTPAALECLDELLKQYPDDGNLSLCKLGCLRELARREERLRLFEQLCAKPGIDPIFWQQYAQELRADDRQHAAAASWVNWASRYRSSDPALISARADLLWDRREFPKATRYYRFAACLGDKNEQYSRSFFLASRHLRETENALVFLKERDQRLGALSANPTITLVESLRHLGRTDRAFEILEAALERRVDDGALRLFAADLHGRFARFDTASRWLREAQGHCPPVAWHRAAASLAGYQNDKTSALDHWRQVLQLEPLAHDAIRAVALLLAETKGRQAALGFLNGLCERFPFSCPLLNLRINWLKEDGAAAVIPYLRQNLQVNPADAWAWRELAVQLAADGKGTSDALSAAEEAIRLEPNHSAGYSVRAYALAQAGRVTEAHNDFREALRLEVDNDFALVRYVDTAPNLAARKEALAVVAEQLRRQVIFSDALSAYQNAARGLLPPQEVLGLLREAHAARPDLWQAWSVLVGQLVEAGDHVEALKLAQEATGRFPLLPRLWVDLARVEQARLNASGESAALEKALELNPSYAYASRQLASIGERQNQLAQARAVLEEAIAANPLDALNHGGLAQVLWKLGEREAAISRLQHALGLHPGYEWAWNALRNWGREVDRPNLAAQMARELTHTRAGEVRSWLILADSLSPQTDEVELFAALDRALELNPRSEEACDTRARALTQLNRFDEALAQCSPRSLRPPPPKLKLRAAWIEAQRGNLPNAIARARALLEEHPDYYGGWQLLSEWCLETQQADEAVRAAETMARLAPLEPVPLGYLGDLKLRLQDRQGAKAAFKRAFALDPDYEYAGFQLVHMQLADRFLAGAEETIKVLERRGKSGRTMACSVALEAARDQYKHALELFSTLCASDNADDWSVRMAVKALDAHGQNHSVDRAIDRQLASGKASPALAEFWVDRQTARGRWGLHSRLKALKAEGEIGRRAVLAYLDRMGEAFQAARQKRDVTTPLRLRYHFHRLLRRHRYWLEPDVEGWGKVGYVLTCIGRPGPAIAWLGDWQKRPNAESWMLYNLAIMLQRKGRYEESRAVIRHAVALRHGGDLHEVFRLWAAFEEALLGNTALAEQHLATLPTEAVQERHRPLQIMTQLLIGLSRESAEDLKTRRCAFRTSLRAAFGKQHPSKATRYVRDAYHRFVAVAAPRAGGVGFRIWGWWFYRGADWLWVALIILLLPAVLVAPPLWLVVAYLLLKRSQRD
jgi:cellulose synthase operon protein C